LGKKSSPKPPLADVIKSALGIQIEGYTHQLNFYFPLVGGISAFISSLAEKIKRLGGKIITNFEVKKVKKEDSIWIVSDEKREKKFDLLINTLPIPYLLEILKGFPSSILDIKNKLKWNSLIVVGIAINRSKISDFHWIYFPDDSIFHRVAIISNYSPNMAPKGKSSVLVEITVPSAQVARMNINNLIERTLEDLEKVKLIRKREVLFAKAWIWNFAYVINHLDYSRDLNLIMKFLDNLNLISVGRWGSWRYLNMDSTIINVKETLENELFHRKIV